MTDASTPTARRRLVQPSERQLHRVPVEAEIAASWIDEQGRDVFEFEWSTHQ